MNDRIALIRECLSVLFGRRNQDVVNTEFSQFIKEDGRVTPVFTDDDLIESVVDRYKIFPLYFT